MPVGRLSNSKSTFGSRKAPDIGVSQKFGLSFNCSHPETMADYLDNFHQIQSSDLLSGHVIKWYDVELSCIHSYYFFLAITGFHTPYEIADCSTSVPAEPITALRSGTLTFVNVFASLPVGSKLECTVYRYRY